MWPALTITSPANGAAIDGTTVDVYYASSGDLTGADHVHLQIDNEPEVRGLSFNGNHQFTNVQAGQHAVRGYLATAAHARINNSDTSVYFSVSVPDTMPPAVSVNILNGSVLSGSIIIEIAASDNVAVSHVELYKDEVFFANDTTAPYQYMWNTLDDANALHTIFARAFDTSNNKAVSPAINVLINNSADVTVPPVASDISVSSLAANSAAVTWRTDRPAKSQIEYGLDENYGLFTQLDSALKTSHDVVITGLESSKTYHYRVLSADENGFLQPSIDQVFATLSSPAPSGSGGGGGGGGAAGDGIPVISKRPESEKPASTVPVDSIQLTSDLKPGEFTRMTVPENFPVKAIVIESSQPSTAVVEIKKINSTNVPEPPAKVYSYLRIDVNTTTAFSYAELEFEVPKEWVDSQGFRLDKIKMLRYGNGWERLDTYYTGDTTTNYQFRAVVPGFSLFAVVGETDFTDYITPADEGVSIQPIVSPAGDYTPSQQYFIISGVMLLIAVLLYFYYHRKRRPHFDSVFQEKT